MLVVRITALRLEDMAQCHMSAVVVNKTTKRKTGKHPTALTLYCFFRLYMALRHNEARWTSPDSCVFLFYPSLFCDMLILHMCIAAMFIQTLVVIGFQILPSYAIKLFQNCSGVTEDNWIVGSILGPYVLTFRILLPSG